MTFSKNLLIAALLSSVAAVSFAQTPATLKPATLTATTPAAPADTASPVKKHHHHKHHAKKAAAAMPAASATK